MKDMFCPDSQESESKLKQVFRVTDSNSDIFGKIELPWKISPQVHTHSTQVQNGNVLLHHVVDDAFIVGGVPDKT